MLRGHGGRARGAARPRPRAARPLPARAPRRAPAGTVSAGAMIVLLQKTLTRTDLGGVAVKNIRIALGKAQVRRAGGAAAAPARAAPRVRALGSRAPRQPRAPRTRRPRRARRPPPPAPAPPQVRGALNELLECAQRSDVGGGADDQALAALTVTLVRPPVWGRGVGGAPAAATTGAACAVARPRAAGGQSRSIPLAAPPRPRSPRATPPAAPGSWC
jgi:hypothetical protein